MVRSSRDALQRLRRRADLEPGSRRVARFVAHSRRACARTPGASTPRTDPPMTARMTDKRARDGSARPSLERRRHPRAATTFAADLVAEGQRYPARVINLSVGGALLDFRGASSKPSIAIGAR